MIANSPAARLVAPQPHPCTQTVSDMVGRRRPRPFSDMQSQGRVARFRPPCGKAWTNSAAGRAAADGGESPAAAAERTSSKSQRLRRPAAAPRAARAADVVVVVSGTPVR